MAFAKQGQNKPDDYNYTAEKMREVWGPMGKNHVYADGEYTERPYIHQDFPKMKYHADYVHDQKPGTLYSFTESAQLVNNPEEEKALGEEWKNSPADFGIVTQPDTKSVQLKRLEEAKQGQSWRKGANIPNEEVNESHLEFARQSGVPNLEGLGDLYKFLATLTVPQMRDFMKESANANKPAKRGPGRPAVATA